MPGTPMSDDYAEANDGSQRAELYAPESDGLYTSQLRDWVPLSPELRDSAVRLYWIMRALVIEKHGPVRKLTLLQLCYLLPAKPVKAGESVKPSSLARVRSLLTELSGVGLISTPEGGPIKTSSRAGASAAPLRIRINDMPRPGYTGPRNAFALLDQVRKPAEEAALKAVRKERERAEQKRAQKAEADAGQISSPQGTGQISSPQGQISSPQGQISSPDSGADLQDHEPPLSPPAQSSRSDTYPSVRPSVFEGDARETDGGTDGGSSNTGEKERAPAPAGAGSAPTASVPAPRQVPLTPGVALLLEIGAWRPELLLTGSTLEDQGRMATGLLDAGWSRASVRQVIAGRPLPENTRSVGAVIARRLRDAAAMPVPTPTAGYDVDELPAPSLGTATPPPPRRPEPSPHEPVRCSAADCGRLADVTEPTPLCSGCAGWPACEGGCGRHLPGGGLCGACEWAAALRAEPAADGTCAGWGPHKGDCGRIVQAHGMCGRCLIKRGEDRARAEHARVREDDPELAAALDAMTAAATRTEETSV